MKKKLWVIGNIVMGIVCSLLVLGMIVVLIPEDTKSTKGLNIEEMSAYSYRASELYAAGIFYTDKALTTNPEETSYEGWKEYVDNAEMYWNELEEVLKVIEENAESEEFLNSFKDTKITSNPFIMKAYALESETIINTFDNAKAGQKLKAVASLLGKDMKYAFSALETVQGEITAESWNDYGDTAMRIEQGLRVAKTAGQGAALYVGVATGGATTAIGEAVAVINGASLIWQVTDDGAFILMGDNYKSNEFVANLNNVSDFVAPIAFAGDMLTMDFSGGMDSLLSTLSIAETVRSMFQDGKIVSINIKGDGGTFISMTKNDLLDYQLAKENGQEIPAKVDDLLRVLEGGKDFVVTPSKETVVIDEKVTFTVEEEKNNYTYIWEYGGNKNEQEINKFTYSYQVAGTYTMKVKVKDDKGIEVGTGFATVTVIDEPEEPEEPEEETEEVNIEVKDIVGEWYASGMASSLYDTQNARTTDFSSSGGYLTILNDGSYEFIEREYNSSGSIVDGRTAKGNINPTDLFYKYIMECNDSELFIDGAIVYYKNNYLYMLMPTEDTNITIYVTYSRK